MRRTDREITDINEIVDVLSRCDTVRLGLMGEDYPYIVSLSFGYEVIDGVIYIYFHGAKEGLKQELIANNNRVCVEADIFYGYRGTGFGITTTYESVIGFGTIRLADLDESIRGLDLLMEHCNAGGYSSAECMKLGTTAVYKITIDKITGKRNLAK